MKRYAFLILNEDGEWMLTSQDGNVMYQREPQTNWAGRLPPRVTISEHIASRELVATNE